MAVDFLCRKSLLSSALSQVKAKISTHSDGNFGIAGGTVATRNPDVHDLAVCAALAVSLASQLSAPLPP